MLLHFTSEEVKHQGHIVGQHRAQSQPKAYNTQPHVVMAQLVIKPMRLTENEFLMCVMANYVRVSKRGC